jgi:hypothetical protein
MTFMSYYNLGTGCVPLGLPPGFRNIQDRLEKLRVYWQLCLSIVRRNDGPLFQKPEEILCEPEIVWTEEQTADFVFFTIDRGHVNVVVVVQASVIPGEIEGFEKEPGAGDQCERQDSLSSAKDHRAQLRSSTARR